MATAYRYHSIEPDGLWTSEPFPAAERRQIVQGVIAGFLSGHPRWATALDGTFIYGLDAKGKEMKAAPSQHATKKKTGRGRRHATKKSATNRSWERVATVSSDWTADANAVASDLADAIERRFGVERMIEGEWPNYRVLAKGDEKTLERARAFAGQWLTWADARKSKEWPKIRAAEAQKLKPKRSPAQLDAEIDAFLAGKIQ